MANPPRVLGPAVRGRYKFLRYVSGNRIAYAVHRPDGVIELCFAPRVSRL